jgi:mannose-1-phosphate guanylyltransferase/mannose-6-phosphate isomerase
VQRLLAIEGMGRPLLVCNESSRFVAAEQLRDIGVDGASIILEPMRRNTAPAIAVAALHALASRTNHNIDPILLVLPSDHVIKDQAAFDAAIAIAMAAAIEGKLVTFGVTPLGPETGYGYIRAAASAPGMAAAVLQFVEKPNHATAKEYVASGNYYWNSGMFVFRASRYLEELTRYQPEIVAACSKALALSKNDFDFIRLDSEAYGASPDNAIDYAIMERTEHACVVAMEAGWSDIGSWASVWEAASKDDRNNATQGDVILQDCNDCLVHGTTRLITAVGMHNTVIVETADALLIMNTSHAQHTKRLVATLHKDKRSEVSQHREVFRPWGSYDSIGNGKRFQVKRISVKPGAKLSLQMHHHRAEHWVVVKGTARITNADNVFLLTENQSTFIPVGVVHSLENPGKIDLELIEIQSGAYLGEDDIVRLEDRYGRS